MLSTDLQLDRAQEASGTTLRALFAAGRSPRHDIVHEFACLFSVGVQLVTGDVPARTIFVRKGRAANDVEKMYQSAAECLWPQDFERRDDALTACAVRALGQELFGIQEEDPLRFYEESRRLVRLDEAAFTTFGVDLTRWQYSIRSLIRTPLRAKEIRQRWPRSRDYWEGAELFDEPWAPQPVARFLGSIGKWSPGAAVAIYDGLALEFPDSTAEAFRETVIDVDGALSAKDVPLPKISFPDSRAEVRRRKPITFHRPGPIALRREIADHRWDGAREVARHPDVAAGWDPAYIDMKVVDESTLPAPHLGSYVEFRRLLRDDRDFSNRQTYMLSRVPSAWSDADFRLQLDLASSSYAEALFTAEVLSSGEIGGPGLFPRIGRQPYPHSFGLHLFVETRDGRLIVAQQSSQKHFYPSHWSVTLEEQVADADVARGSAAVGPWIQRALLEELGLTKMDSVPIPYELNQCRILSLVSLEDISHFAIIGHVPLRLTAEEFENYRPHFEQNVVDHELVDLDYLGLDEVVREFTAPTRLYHPSARARMYLFLLRHLHQELPRRLGLA